jgi:hypothetical protein
MEGPIAVDTAGCGRSPLYELEREDGQGQLDGRDQGHQLYRLRHHDIGHRTYAAVATGLTATSSTSATLTANYWFEVAASIGTNWIGTKSVATAEATISSSRCIQP